MENRFDVYDMDDELWAMWDMWRGYITDWMPKAAYEKWWYVNYGIRVTLPNRKTIYRSEADEKEKIRRERARENNRHQRPAPTMGADGTAG